MRNRSPSIESPTMEDQVKQEFSVTNKLSPTIYPINYSSSTSLPFFSAPNSTNSIESDSYIDYNQDDDDDDEYFGAFPPGYRFRPLDQELFVYYLIKKIRKEELPRNRINEVELYNYSPDTLAATYTGNGEDEWYFFTPRNRKYPNGDRPNRAAGDGYWKATGANTTVSCKGKKLGLKNSLVFYRGKPPKGVKTDWIMHEYKMCDAPKRVKKTDKDKKDMKLDDWVLCKLRKKPKKLEKADKTSKSESVSIGQPIDIFVPENVHVSSIPSIPMMSGVNNNFGDSSSKSESVSIGQPIDIFVPENVHVSSIPSIPIMSGINNNFGDSSIVSSYANGNFESMEAPFEQCHAYNSAYDQQPANDNCLPWIENDVSWSLRIPFHHNVQSPYEQTHYNLHELNYPQDQYFASIIEKDIKGCE